MFDADQYDTPLKMTFTERLFFTLTFMFLVLGIAFFGEALYSKAFAAETPTINLCTDAKVFQDEANLSAFLTAVARAKPGIVAEFGD